MSAHSLPGLDAWLQHNPAYDGPEPSPDDYADARDELGAYARDDEITLLAFDNMQRRLDASRDEAEEYEADSRNDDRDEEGDSRDY